MIAHHPQSPLILTYLFIAISQFGFGLSNGAYMTYVLKKVNRSQYAMSYYAINTAIMALGMLLAGSFSGYLQHWMGYSDFFVWIVLSGLVIVGLTIFWVSRDKSLAE